MYILPLKIQEETPKKINDALLDQLRWATLGYHHNWDSKLYSEDNVSPFPTELLELCQLVIDHIDNLTKGEIQRDLISNYKPEAAIVNFYPTGATLGGHTDHSEPNRYCALILQMI